MDLALLKSIVFALSEKKAEDIQVLKIESLTVIADYFVIATATSTTHVKSLADEVEFVLDGQDIKPLRVEGYQAANWILMDYASVVVHIFVKDTREFYKLEKLWGDAPRVELDTLIGQ
jgi:ribosome-associated protein